MSPKPVLISMVLVVLMGCTDPGRSAKQRGFDALHGGDAATAVEAFEEALAKSPGAIGERSRVYDGLAEAYILLGETAEAQRVLQIWEDARPGDIELARIAYLRANAQGRAGDIQRALFSIEGANERYAKLGGGQPLGTAYILKAQIELGEGRPEDAEMSLYAALDAIDPMVYPNLSAMARTLLEGLQNIGNQ